MKSELACLFAALLALAPQAPTHYRTALPGYRYEFPRDNFNHPDFQTEWWYYTGNLQAADGHHFGFELTFFRAGVDLNAPNTSPWDVRDVYFAHLALSDLDGGRFYQIERINRAGPGIAGASQHESRIWNGNWLIQMTGSVQELTATSEPFNLHLSLRSAKPPVIHGENGVSQKAAGAGHASQYISYTRLLTSGNVELEGKRFDVTGVSWMDHEFFTSQLSQDQVGWDWLSLQLNDNTEVMLFHLRRKDGSIDPYSSGTFVDANGHTTHLATSDFQLEPAGEATWTSPATRAVYPTRWKISIPKLKLDLSVATPLPSQELAGQHQLVPTYWEGAIRVTGQKAPAPISGVGYLEMTGYDRPIQIDRRPVE